MSVVSELRELASLSDLRSFPASWLPLCLIHLSRGDGPEKGRELVQRGC